MRRQFIRIAGTVAALVAAQTVAAQTAGQNAQGQQRNPDAQKQSMARRLEARKPPAQVSGTRPVHMVLVTETGRIAANPAQFYGIHVSVHGGVEEVANRNVFTLDEDAFWQIAENIAVIMPDPTSRATALDADDYVTVVGTVRPFIRAELERDYDWFDDLPDINVELEGRPVIIAELVRTADGVEAAKAPAVSHILVTDAGDIAELPRRFYGRSVSVRADVEDVWSPRVFTLDEDEWFAGPDVLVFNPFPAREGAVADLEDDEVTVWGMVRPFIVAEFEQDYDWFDAADYDRVELDDFERRAAIVASSIVGNGRDFVEFRPELALDAAAAEVADRAGTWARMTARFADAGRTETGTTGQARKQAVAGTTGRTEPAQANRKPAAKETITSVRDLIGAPADSVVDRAVRLDRVDVQRVIDDKTFLVGASEAQAVVVRLPQPPAKPVRAGQAVRVEGRVVRAPATAAFDRPYLVEARTFEPID